jgi:hypothetical protein
MWSIQSPPLSPCYWESETPTRSPSYEDNPAEDLYIYTYIKIGKWIGPTSSTRMSNTTDRASPPLKPKIILYNFKSP